MSSDQDMSTVDTPSSADEPMQCFTQAHIAHWWGINRSAVTMMRKRWGPDSAAPFPTPDIEVPTVNGDSVIAGWAWNRWPAEFDTWNERRSNAGRQRQRAARTSPRTPARARKPMAPKTSTAAPHPAEDPGPEHTDLADQPMPPVRDFIKPARRRGTGGVVRQGRVAGARMARAVAKGKLRR
ncbi:MULTISPECIES: hypothetical protein [Amycolatopsis]|uniref:Uncharacterized protein n=1 Tax=Amycolatopsis saalfeldensis TaxID=394193 RepID=A0A1H8YSR5_9PSEU|nr:MULTISPECIES: hypothetical protein [Amycolatopsis]SEP54428.1 hypothetical protein SAMN04489732_1474 [Amycolatopsis saalfeldensis]